MVRNNNKGVNKMNWDKQTKFTVKFILVLALCAVFYVLGGYNNQVAHKKDATNAVNSYKAQCERISNNSQTWLECDL